MKKARMIRKVKPVDNAPMRKMFERIVERMQGPLMLKDPTVQKYSDLAISVFIPQLKAESVSDEDIDLVARCLRSLEGKPKLLDAALRKLKSVARSGGKERVLRLARSLNINFDDFATDQFKDPKVRELFLKQQEKLRAKAASD